jgi:hypothetical protein
MVERVLVLAQSTISVSSCQNGSSGSVAAIGSAQLIEIGNISVFLIDTPFRWLRPPHRWQCQAVEANAVIAGGSGQKPHELPFRRLQRAIRHVVDEPDREHAIGRFLTVVELIGLAHLRRRQRGADNQSTPVVQKGHAWLDRFIPPLQAAGVLRRLARGPGRYPR